MFNSGNTGTINTFTQRTKRINDQYYLASYKIIIEPVHEISNNVVCATSKAADQPALMCSLIRVFASRMSIL